MTVAEAEHRVLHEIDALAAEMVAFTQAMVRIPTENPPGRCYAECAEFIAHKLREFGYAIETVLAAGLSEHSAEYPRINVIGRLRPANPPVQVENMPQSRVLHFNGHYDVVPPGSGWTVDPFGGELTDGRLYGRGTCDQKAGIAASIYAVEAIRRAGIPLAGEVEQSATPDEESGGFAGVAYLCDIGRISAANQQYVVITEPLDPERVCIGHRGVYWFELTTIGRVGHGSMPGLAVNAAEQMARLIQVFATQLKPVLASRISQAPVQPPQARRPSINLNSIHAGQALGGWQTPAVPDRCTAIFDRRFLHEETFDDVRAEIVQLLEAEGVAYELRDLMRVDPLLGSSEMELPRATERAIRDVLNVEPSFLASPGTYDQKHIVRRAGITECIAYGPGRLVMAHQPDEYVAVDDLIASAKVMALLTLRLLG
ncbi:MAG: acetylornithine deacetylase/succinyl-diaminopimelate desuccinylase family protein [Chloroflexi bacterium]|nr:acetylornithine deacetylase/succinyl-diaminopimelate desuccinylase family protein [Chloroflexota bacterium]